MALRDEIQETAAAAAVKATALAPLPPPPPHLPVQRRKVGNDDVSLKSMEQKIDCTK